MHPWGALFALAIVVENILHLRSALLYQLSYLVVVVYFLDLVFSLPCRLGVLDQNIIKIFILG